MNKTGVLLAMALLLAACGNGEQAKMVAAKQCQDQSMTQPMNKLDVFLLGCMKAKGYVFDKGGANCALADIKEESANCYKKAD